LSGQPPAGAYPGNLSLPVEVREKILSTFRHTLDLFRDGKLDDCLIGCDFILKMDPRFAPARKLQEKAKNPRADVDLAELRAFAASPAAPQPPPARETGPVKPATPASQRSSRTTPWISPGDSGTAAAPRDTDPAAVEGLENLSLDSLSLDGPLPDLSEPGGSREAGLPFAGLGSGDVSAPAFGDFSRRPSAGDSDLASPPAISTEQEIAALLRQGDDANAGGDKQQAIEIWSRIFLLDINNADAVSRIEKTRAEMAEESRRVAAALEQGQESFEKGDLASARKQFDAVLHLDEGPTGAVPPSPRVAAEPAPLSPHDLSSVVATGDVLAEEMEQSGPPGKRSWSSTLRPRSEPAAEKPEEEASKRPTIRVNRRIAILGGVVLAVVAAGIFVVTRPRGTTTQVARSGSAPSLEHATALFREGKIVETTEELRRIPRSDPDYAKAQKLLASLEAAKASVESAPVASAPAPAAAVPQTVTSPATLRAEAEKALSEKRYIDAMKAFSAAAPSFMGDPTFAKEMASASEKVTELTPAVKLYNDGEYETAIPILWRIYQASRDNQDARSYLLRSYFNQGIAQLQNGLYDKAKESFNEVLGLDPHDVEAARHVEFADHYRTGDLDLLGRIYVRYISPRP
jgi:tetratricopeptide (TPR) repeat protein